MENSKMSEAEMRHTVSINTKSFRAVCGYTQEDVADKCDITSRTVHNIEHEKCMPTLSTLIRLSQCFEVPIDTLITSNKKKTTNL